MAEMLVCVLSAPPTPDATPAALLPAFALGALFIIICAFAMGIDFPQSRRRFSRLSG
jgi:hypothetical protein